MKYILLALFAITFVKYVSSTCNYWKAGDCVKQRTDCTVVANCSRDSEWCLQTKECYMKTPSCSKIVSILTECSTSNQCTDAFYFKTNIETKCWPIIVIPVGGASAPTGFLAIIICFLAYFAKEI